MANETDQPPPAATDEAVEAEVLEEGALNFAGLYEATPTYALERTEPVIDRISRRQLSLIRAKAPQLTWEELGQAMELAWSYRLDPFAGEIWFAKSRTGKLLIMVGRDGLRKIVQRNGLDMDCDVVRKHDLFRVDRGPDRTRVITHSYEGGDVRARGEIVGAWAETWDPETGKQRGYFYAPYHEYKPTNPKVLEHSPWGSQESVMMLAAAERQSARQATPLGGLLTEGEMDLNDQRALDGGTTEAPDGVALEAVVDGLEDVSDAVKDNLLAAMVEANALTPGIWSAGKAQMAFQGRTEDQLVGDAAQILQTSEEMRQRIARVDAARAAAEEDARAKQEKAPPDAEVVPPSERRAELEHDIADAEERLGTEGELTDEADRAVAEARLDKLRRELANLPED